LLRYIIQRLFQGVLAAFVLLTLVFVFARISGNPLDLVTPPEATLAERAAAAERLGLDQPWIVQYFKFVGGLFHGDFGTSIRFNKPVTDLFFGAFPNTLGLAGLGLLFAVVFGVSLGVLSATKRGKAIDFVARGISALGLSAPEFWIGMMLILVVALRMGLLPISGMSGPASYVLPALTMSLPVVAGISRLMRSSLVESLDSEYIKLARIKGVSEGVVVWKHGVRNALLPVVTFLGINLVHMVNGSVTVEMVFAWPGVGRLMYGAVSQQDYPLEQGLLLILGLLVILMNLLVDILYTYIDPRIRFGSSKGK
jgi:peptide/nickel transport system permease protein